VFLLNSCQRYFSCVPMVLAPIGKALFRSYGCFFAEFLGDHSLVRLGLLDLTTCVGLRYGVYEIKLRKFSWKRALLYLPLAEHSRFAWIPHQSEPPDLPGDILTTRTSNPIMRTTYCTPSFHRISHTSRNINRVSIGCGIRHPLRTD
jgi:hypothetical protein